MGDFFKIILYRPKGISAQENVRENLIRKLTKSQKTIYKSLKNNPELTSSELALKAAVTEWLIKTIKSAHNYKETLWADFV